MFVYTSTPDSLRAKSPVDSLASTPRSIQIGFTPSGKSAPVDILPAATRSSSHLPAQSFSSCTLNRSSSSNGHANAYVSDEDLFGDDDMHFLLEAPPPPRPAHLWAMAAAQPLLPPVTRPRPRVSFRSDKKRRTSSSSKK